MTSKAIAAFDELTVISDTDLLIVESTHTKKATALTLAGYFSGHITGFTIGQVSGLQLALDAKQPINGNLNAIAAAATSADTLWYFSGSATGALTTFTSFGRSLVGAADGPAGQTVLGISAFAQTFLDDTTSRVFRGTTNTRHEFQIKVSSDSANLTTGDGKIQWMVPESIDGLDLLSAHAGVSTASSSGLPNIQIRNVDNGNVDMLSTPITIDANEKSSYTAATQPAVNASNKTVTKGQFIAIDVDVAGTSAGGLTVDLVFG